LTSSGVPAHDPGRQNTRGRRWLFWTTLTIGLGQVLTFVLALRVFAFSGNSDSATVFALVPILAVADVILDVVCLVVGRRANRILGVVALVAVVAQVTLVALVLVGLSHANFVL
jgi:hypothetical protein